MYQFAGPSAGITNQVVYLGGVAANLLSRFDM